MRVGTLTMCLAAAAIVSAAAVAACSEGAPSPSTIEVHPTPGNVPAVDERNRISSQAPMSSSGRLYDLARRVAEAREVFRIGVSDGAREYVFGNIQDAAFDSNGNPVVLDSRYNEVRAYSHDGVYLYAIGRTGRGPTELAAPEAMSMLGDTVVVVDRFNAVKWLASINGEAVLLRSVNLDFVPEDLCLIGDRVVIHGHRQAGGILHEILPDGSMRSFGSGYQSPTALVRQQLSDARIGCAASAKRVVHAFEWFPWLFGTQIDSLNDRWAGVIDGFFQADVESSSDPISPWVEQSGERFDIIRRIVSVDGWFMLVQVDHQTLESRRQRRYFAYSRTYVVDGMTGQGVFSTDKLPAIFAVRESRMVAAVNDSVPQLLVFSLSTE